ncbi:MAG: site-specific tyrosine recombinase XerD [Porphyromonadaceae bacterium]|nr:site-specific tyrosine recombinase XerD [Porphyromonadaceae bacterium]
MIVSHSEPLKLFARYLKLEKGLSDNTIDGYLRDTFKLFQYLSSDATPSVAQLANADIAQFICHLQDFNIQPRSQARILSGLRSFYTFLRLEGYMDNDPMELIEGPKLGRKLPEILTVEEIDTIINSFDRSKPESQRNRAIIETMYSCGLRVSELVGLRISQIYSEEEYILVEGKGRKQRLVPISKSALREIKYYLQDRCHLTPQKGDEDILFLNRRGGHLSRVMVFNILKERARACGIQKNISPHTLRHSFATHLLEGGANLRAIQQMLGHENITTTEIYVHLDKTLLRNEILSHHPRNNRKK